MTNRNPAKRSSHKLGILSGENFNRKKLKQVKRMLSNFGNKLTRPLLQNGLPDTSFKCGENSPFNKDTLKQHKIEVGTDKVFMLLGRFNERSIKATV